MVERTKREEKKKDRPSRVQEEPEKQDAIMLEDRELVIDTSEKIEIIQSFDQLGLSEALLRGKSNYHLIQIRTLLIRVQQAVGGAAAGDLAYYQTERCYRAKPEWNWKNLCVHTRSPADT